MADNNDNDISDNTPPPPPPPPGGDAFAPKDLFRDTPDDDNGGLESGTPTVAASPTRVFIVLGLMGTLLLYLLYNIFFATKEELKTVEQPSRDVVKNQDGTVNVAPLPEFEEEEIPAPPPLEPPPIPDPQNLPEISQQEDNANNKALLDRLKSEILISNGSSVFNDNDSNEEAEQQLAGTDGNRAFNNMVMRSNTRAPKVTATHIGALNRTIAQGRLIHATMESAINTDLPAPIRAIVARDVYAEAGAEPLIPKGSRLIGEYNSSILFGQTRVNVMWTRVIRPDGVDVALGSPLVDQIGQAGIGGVVDNKFREMFSRAVLASVFTIAVALAVDESGLETESTTVVQGDSTQTTSTASGEATREALENMGDLTTEFIQRFINVKPTIIVDQGTPVMVFVNRDLIFPPEYVGAQQIP